MMELSERAKFALVLSGGVVLPGLGNYALKSATFPYSNALGSLVWVVGYIGAMLLIWYVWLRPLDLTGPGA
ncbi:hypothetical protein [Halorientalis litorea]|uniref:hypothetical protein n=1 Tax=Halorientalis litorea TaxID=2931977 RepID=UPI0027E387B8|nr:hypothetical protein [Halorientalis litorea]